MDRVRFSFASVFKISSFETVKIWRTALSSRFQAVLPSTFGAGSGFMASSYHSDLCPGRLSLALKLAWVGCWIAKNNFKN